MIFRYVGTLATIALVSALAAAEQPDFVEKSRRAALARAAGRIDEGAVLYRECVKLRPAWIEGWWYLGTLEYERNSYAAARDAFRAFLKLKPDAAPALALLGLAEYETKEFPESLGHLERSLALEGGGDPSVSRAVRYHAGLLLLQSGEFERAVQRLSQAALLGGENRDLILALGFAGLRKPIRPSDGNADDRAIGFELGQVMYLAATRQAAAAAQGFVGLIEKHPARPELHNLYGGFLLSSDPDGAIREWKRELAISPGHVPARLQLAYEYLKRGDAASGLPYAREAVQFAPRLFVAHNALGRLLIDSGDLPGGIAALEVARQLAPDSPETRTNLASAYQQAGRKEDAARERAEFQRLKANTRN